MSIELLQGYTERIKRYNCDIKNFYIDIAMNLCEIQEFNFLDGTEYKNIKDYALDEFGYESSKTYDLINIYKKFFYDERKKKIGILTYGKYSISQLRYMLSMSDEQIKQCNFNMTVKEIKQLKIKKSARADSVDIDNTHNFKNEILGQNVITGVFPEKKEEEKQSTIIISELPNSVPAATETETRTIVTETIITQNNNFVPNEYETYKEKYEQNCSDALKLKKEIEFLEIDVDNYKVLLDYFYSELYNINNPLQNDKIEKLLQEIYDYNRHNVVPSKILFMQNVI